MQILLRDWRYWEQKRLTRGRIHDNVIHVNAYIREYQYHRTDRP